MLLSLQINVLAQDDIYFVPEKKKSGNDSRSEVLREFDSTSVSELIGDSNEKASEYEKYRADKELKYFVSQTAKNKQTVNWDEFKNNRSSDSLSSDKDSGESQNVIVINNYVDNDDYYYANRFHRPYYNSFYDPYYRYSSWGSNLSVSWYDPYYYDFWGYSPYYSYYSPYYHHYYYHNYNYHGYYDNYDNKVSNRNSYSSTNYGRRRSYSGMETPLNSSVANGSSRRVESSNGAMGISSSYPSNPDGRRSSYNSNTVNSQVYNRSTERRSISSGNSQSAYTPSYSEPRSENRPTYNSNEKSSRRSSNSSGSSSSTREGTSYSGGSDNSGGSRRSSESYSPSSGSSGNNRSSGSSGTSGGSNSGGRRR